MKTNLTNETATGQHARLIPILECVMIVAYMVFIVRNTMNSMRSMDIEGMVSNSIAAQWVLSLLTLAITVLCFMPKFKSKLNTKIAVVNIVWLIFFVFVYIIL